MSTEAEVVDRVNKAGGPLQGVLISEYDVVMLDGKPHYRMGLVEGYALRMEGDGDVRYWQAFYNILFALAQNGVPMAWPELFYEEEKHRGYQKFYKRFNIDDGYIFPIT